MELPKWSCWLQLITNPDSLIIYATNKKILFKERFVLYNVVYTIKGR